MTPAQFKATRQALMLSQHELAEMLQVTNMSVSNWERGVNPIGHVTGMAMEYLWLKHNLQVLRNPIRDINAALEGML